MSSFRTLAWLCGLYLALYGAGIGLWIGSPLSNLDLLLCALPAPFAGLVLALHRGEPSEFLTKLVACLLMLPIMQLFWAMEVVEGLPTTPAPVVAAAPVATATPTTPTAPQVDTTRLFAGALQPGGSNPGQGVMLSIHGGVWRDGTELQLMRFATPQAASAYLDSVVRVQQSRKIALGARRGVELLPHGTNDDAADFIYTEVLGADVLHIRAPNAELAEARLSAGGLPPSAAASATPVATPAATATQPAADSGSKRPIWTGLVGFGLGHLVCAVLFMMWAAPVSTRVGPQAGVVPADASSLQARLSSLADAGLGCELLPAEQPNEVLMRYVWNGEVLRGHSFRIEVDAARRTVYVREEERISGAKPRDSSEADMRVGGMGFDPTSPKATSVYQITRSATFIDPTRLASVDVQLEPTRAFYAEPPTHEANAKHIAYTLAAVVTRSGYTYQPILFGFQRRS